MRVLAIDPGLTRCGVAVLDGAPGTGVTLSFATVIRTDAKSELGLRLRDIDAALYAIATEYKPNVFAVERVFSQHNVQSVIGTAQASGVGALVAAKLGLKTEFYTPTEVKAAVSGSGTADKAQVAAMVQRIVKAKLDGPADLTDAVALGICHLWRGASQARLIEVAAKSRGRVPVSGGGSK